MDNPTSSPRVLCEPFIRVAGAPPPVPSLEIESCGDRLDPGGLRGSLSGEAASAAPDRAVHCQW